MGGRGAGAGAGAGVSEDPVAAAVVEAAWDDDAGLVGAEVEAVADAEVVADADEAAGALEPAGKCFSR